MLKFLPVLSMLVAVTATPAFAAEPAEAVRYFYDNLGMESDPENRGRFTGPALDFFNAADAAWLRDETNCIEFGFPVDAQDFDEEEIARTLTLDEAVEGDTATVSAKFDNFGKATTIEWTLQNAATGWLVSDIASSESAWRVSAMSCK
ncbi:MAG: hypothetical protein KUA43_17655 [Hoeflea sp.]|uniref:hypothetical protein n=1 Tax=Hoeflea sp. TaxID=1940281 RepID=UPI001DE07C91|nr:hypothetical protein [Hoeflea sp.]MBU4529103.1 hypothetical protein [Alphaproteobacteria bacterium]MBU4543508.1 hypothetical protein [Alphaproteobacteria bacterium]MBU4549133.1 hypothetical protein [Alphaproteobacteria bacterium]MBV1725268.1 hypothetical protein [Hoeflea sp.]MBV1785229.1 hypothetical protein [Hoeflea sp.]